MSQNVANFEVNVFHNSLLCYVKSEVLVFFLLFSVSVGQELCMYFTMSVRCNYIIFAIKMKRKKLKYCILDLTRVYSESQVM